MEDNKNLYFILFALSLGWTVLYADRTSLYPLLSVIGRDFNLNNTQLGTITSSYFLVYVAMQIPGGIVADKVGKKRLIVLGILTAGVSLFCFGLFGKSYSLLVLFAALHGLGAGTYYPCAYGIMLELVDSKHWGTSAAIINLGMSFGLILGLAISGPLYMRFKSYSAIFIGLALFTMALSLLFIKILPEAESRCNEKTNFFAVKEVLKNKNLLLLYIAQFCALYGYWTAVTWGATFFKEERGIGMELAGLFVAIAGMSSIIPSLVMGRISDIFGRKKIALILFPLGALTLYLMAHVRTASAIILSLIAYGIIGKSSWDPIAVAWSGSHASALGNEAASTAMGVFNFFGMMSAVVAPVVTGFIRDITGSLVAAYYVAAVLSLLGGSLVILVDEKLPQPDNKLG
ncbi:putative sulfoacetate transporter SauU [Fervidicola ferrireducens]|uniref:Putative sulfoacetate transporter SauU n=1 Tax=Fervidicola ferrireducens TaxID=520764 RepID=A0A140L116_9FIRM|nr:MFS transporter [Fervidicola ferrireducens]KXG74241.1 putative sulfoacetate transporter SauU [Fervidicola ferrireducens]